ncbi:HAD-IA family hydrolase [Microtetraspora sp. NBRC 16547]|uniref:HAD family hydrolase n=1 Tax=Microtetraspora sp. NBRC 16547 TaxID=3030993 RepID=UPI0024A51E43|nr:HAD-IA family hydrolase [Microtetraspora sp. NBRC 16547]GLX02512.1 hydrolase [Microtetraspora sp. NBRC 16547]
MIKGAMFDFSGTLFRVEPTETWLRMVVTEAGYDMPEDDLTACAARLEEAGALPGGPLPRRVPPDLATLWRERDLSAERHRAAYTALAREAALPCPDLADALYDRTLTPAAWQPYPDTESTLKELRGRGIPVAVVSNIGWDLRRVFRHHGVDDLITHYLLSCEQGTKKPDPAIFQAACTLLGLAPDEVVMVGDDRAADGGAAALGCAVHLVDHLPVDQRPAALTAVLDLLDPSATESALPPA